LKLRLSLPLVRHGTRSPPSRRRGLKHGWWEQAASMSLVASLAEAWIETIHACILHDDPQVASLAEAWIETMIQQVLSRYPDRRLPRGGVD